MKKKHLILVSLIILGFILRFYRLADWLYFTMDEERDAFIVKRIIVDHKLTLIGGSVPGGFYVGPGWYYFSVIPLALAKLNPVSLGMVASGLGVFSIWLIYLVAKRVFNEKIGLISASLFSASFLMVVYNRHYWPLTPGPIIGLTTLLSLNEIIKNKNYKYSYLLALSLGMGLNSDPSNFILILLTLFVWWFYRLTVRKKEVIVSALIVVLSILPLVLFDLRHDFLNSRALLKLFSFQGKGRGNFNIASFSKIFSLFPNTFSRLIYPFGDLDISRQLTICSKYINQRAEAVPLLLIIFSTLVLAHWLIKGLKNKKQKKELGISLISFQLLICLICLCFFGLVFPNHLHEYFLSPVLPSFIFLIALTVEKLLGNKKSFILVTVLAGFVLLNGLGVLNSSNSLGLENKRRGARYVVDQVKGEPFSLESLSTCFRFGGYRYLFYLAGHEPVKSFMDPYYSWLYDQEPWENEPGIKAVFVSHDLEETEEFWQEYEVYQSESFDQKRFGDTEVLLIKNNE